ncbi:MAG: hypothetical protein P1P89_13910 [Desulfobacterales bacterium]|nr:hypothetical protein [Desulfobacterales bacterium]
MKAGIRGQGSGIGMVIAFCAMVLLPAGCASVPKCPVCPADNVIFMAQDGSLVSIPKGFFDQGDGESWMRLEDFKKRMQDARRQQGGM